MVVEQDIYRTLVKFALSIVDSQYLVAFDDTIDWINRRRTINHVPKIGILVSNEMFTRYPQMMIYIRKDEDKSLPYAVAEFRYLFYVFVLILPLTTKDTIDFSAASDYEKFWNFFKHYSSNKGWKFRGFHDETPRNFVLNLNLEFKKDEREDTESID